VFMTRLDRIELPAQRHADHDAEDDSIILEGSQFLRAVFIALAIEAIAAAVVIIVWRALR
jgi:hypothetical protein